MSKLLPAVGLAATLVKTIDFCVRILHERHTIYQGANVAGPEDQTFLQDITNTLYQLYSILAESCLKRLGSDKKSTRLSESAPYLLKLSDEVQEIVSPLIDAFLQVQSRVSFSDPEWKSAREALLTVWKEKDIAALKKKLKAIRKLVDATLLLILRQHLDHPAEGDLPASDVDDSQQHHRERWQSATLEAIQANDWKPKNKKHTEDFSEKVDALILAEEEAQFYKGLFANLYFVEQNDRLQSISAPHEGSFKWIFEAKPHEDISFPEWLGSSIGRNLFWITGKPGCGKSTLMKYLFRNEHLYPWLEEWSGNAPGFLTGGFLWNCGTVLQKTTVGLLRSLLYETLQDMIYGPLEQDPRIIQLLFKDRWKQFKSHGGGLHDFTLPELRSSFDILISNESRKFLFLLDGLDELDDSPTNILDIILRATNRENVKICISSRASPILQRAFDGYPGLELDRWTRNGILSCVLFAFDQNDTMFNIPPEQSDGTEERAIINTIVEKASGVFLWAFLATEILIQSTDPEDDVPTIRDRVDFLPSDLVGLLYYIFDRMDPKELEQLSKLSWLIDAHDYPGLLPLCFAADPDLKSSLAADPRPLTSLEILTSVEDMRNLVKFKCKNLLSIFAAVPPEEVESDASDFKHYKVHYTHHSIRDFLQSEKVRGRIKRTTGRNFLNTDENWANSHLWTLKIFPSSASSTLMASVLDCIEYAIRLELATKRVRLTYLDEVGATFNHHLSSLPNATLGFPLGISVQSFLDIAVWLNLFGYVAIKAQTAEKKDIRHAMDYCKEARRVVGLTGEEKWFGSRLRLRGKYAQGEHELYSLLEFNTKSGRFGSQKQKKPSVELPEWV